VLDASAEECTTQVRIRFDQHREAA
jgi:hypothetical protein